MDDGTRTQTADAPEAAHEGTMRATAYRMAIDAGVAELAAWLKRRRATILTYHGVVGTPPKASSRALYKLMVPADEFRAQMQMLRARYNVVPLEELTRKLANGDSVERLAAVTFDDGWETTRTVAAPILRELGIPSTVFVATGLIGRVERGLWTQRLWNSLVHAESKVLRCGVLEFAADTQPRRRAAIAAIASACKRMSSGERRATVARLIAKYGAGPPLPDDLAWMTWDQVRELPAIGMSVGAHTVDHEILSGLSLDDVRAQVRLSKRAIEERLGVPCRLFAYPNGSAQDFSDRHARILREEGFLAACTQIPGRNGPLADAFRLRRINVGLDHTRASFIAEIDGLRHWP